MNNVYAFQIGAIVLSALSASPVLAQQSGAAESAKTSGWYVGGAVGRGGLRTGYEATKATIVSTGATTGTIFADAVQTMWKIYVGYKLMPQLSIEGGYWNYGKPGYSADITAPVTTTMRRGFSVEGYGADAVLWLPMTNSLSGFGKIGAIRSSVRADGVDPGAPLSSLPAESVRKINAHYGLGLQLNLRTDLAARLEFETVRGVGDASKFGSADVLMWSVGMNYKF